MKDTSESLFHIGVSDSIHALSLITITIKNNRYYKLGVVLNDPEGDVIFPSFKLQDVIGQLDLEPVSASTNMSKLYHLQRCVQPTISTLIKKEKKQYKLSDFPSAEFQSFPALDFALRCFAPTESAHPARILDANAFIVPDQVLQSVLGEKLVSSLCSAVYSTDQHIRAMPASTWDFGSGDIVEVIFNVAVMPNFSNKLLFDMKLELKGSLLLIPNTIKIPMTNVSLDHLKIQ
ncbi:hypothetical protein GYMLUDRAFT_252491 [Collybiopsis luxurians FD-317 M1]|uniref:Uncharacterized protein n=1 Tax=Collybiopsis luxurians FD-317 M1 TaxID=944289 RepID=A0A0D0BNC3_9AGAR|nr:hypothetical protein GYMLUDRAFT_252491 [Collybiopsis luxurians FD-317 M1]